MSCVILNCATQISAVPGLDIHTVSAVPTRKELRFLDELAKQHLPTDPTPSLEDISAQPDVRHLSEPELAPQKPHLTEPLRVVVIGNDAALSAVLTRMMRADYLWAEVGFVPTELSTAAQNWALPATPSEALQLAVHGDVHPVPLIRNDAGQAIAGSATISEWNNGEITGEIIVDDDVLVHHDPETQRDDNASVYGSRLVPMVDAPGIVAAKAISPVAANDDLDFGKEKPASANAGSGLGGWFRKKFSRTTEPGQLDPNSVLHGRAVQAGGPSLRVIVDGISAKRPVNRVTFYRHLRDLQVVRHAD